MMAAGDTNHTIIICVITEIFEDAALPGPSTSSFRAKHQKSEVFITVSDAWRRKQSGQDRDEPVLEVYRKTGTDNYVEKLPQDQVMLLSSPYTHCPTLCKLNNGDEASVFHVLSALWTVDHPLDNGSSTYFANLDTILKPEMSEYTVKEPDETDVTAQLKPDETPHLRVTSMALLKTTDDGQVELMGSPTVEQLRSKASLCFLRSMSLAMRQLAITCTSLAMPDVNPCTHVLGCHLCACAEEAFYEQ